MTYTQEHIGRRVKGDGKHHNHKRGKITNVLEPLHGFFGYQKIDVEWDRGGYDTVYRDEIKLINNTSKR